MPGPLRFSGKVSINFTMATATGCAVLHAGPRLTITAAYLGFSDGHELRLAPDRISHDATAETLTLWAWDDPGHSVGVRLTIEFAGVVHDDTAPGGSGASGLFLSPNTV